MNGKNRNLTILFLGTVLVLVIVFVFLANTGSKVEKSGASGADGASTVPTPDKRVIPTLSTNEAFENVKF